MYSFTPRETSRQGRQAPVFPDASIDGLEVVLNLKWEHFLWGLAYVHAGGLGAEIVTVTLHHAAEADSDHALDANLFVQQLPDGPQFGFPVVGGRLVHDDVHNHVLGEVVLDEP